MQSIGVHGRVAETIDFGCPTPAGKGVRVGYEYVRHGIVNIFMTNEPLKESHPAEVTKYKTKRDWAMFVKRLADEQYPEFKKITLVIDNFRTHAASAFYETFAHEEAKRIWDRFDSSLLPTRELAEHGANRAAYTQWPMSQQVYIIY